MACRAASAQVARETEAEIGTRAADRLTLGTLSDRDGKYELRGVPPGSHTLELLRYVARSGPG